MSKINPEVLPYDPTFKPEKATKAEYTPPVAKWAHELPKEHRQPQESPLKRWYLEQQAKKGIEMPVKANPIGVHGLFSRKMIVGSGSVVEKLSDDLKLR